MDANIKEKLNLLKAEDFKAYAEENLAKIATANKALDESIVYLSEAIKSRKVEKRAIQANLIPIFANLYTACPEVSDALVVPLLHAANKAKRILARREANYKKISE